MSTKYPFTLAILAKNEENNIRECVQPFADLTDDIVLLDDGSTDATSPLAQAQGARVIDVSTSSGFAEKRNKGLELAKYDYVLFVDADERPDKTLLNWLKEVDFSSDIVCYRISRVDYFWGREVRHGEVASAVSGIPRLMNKNFVRYEGSVHESVKLTGSERTNTAAGVLAHYPHQTVSEFVRDINRYSSERAIELRGKKNELQIVFEMIVYPPLKFWYTYIVKLGFLDGAPGFVYSFLMAFHSFLVRTKLLANSS